MSGTRGGIEWEFSEGPGGGGNFMATGKAVTFLRTHLARGEMEQALHLYESCAENVGDELLAEFVNASTKLQKAMANLFYRARDYKRAGLACEHLDQWEAAGRAYEAACAYEKSAECYLRAEKPSKAAQVFQKAGMHDRASALFRQQKDHVAAANALHVSGDPVGASQILIDAGDLRAAARRLATVSAAHPRFPEVVVLLADVLLRLEHGDVAAQRLSAALPIGAAIVDAGAAAIAYKLGEIHAEFGRSAEAVRSFERVRAFDPDYRDVAARLVALGASSRRQSEDFSALAGNVFLPRKSAPSGARGASFSDLDPHTGIAGGVVTRMEGYDLLKTLPIFEQLSLDEMKDFYHLCENVQVAAGDVLIEQGQPGQGLYIIREGTIRVSKIDREREIVVAKLQAGKYVGEMSLIDDGPTSARVTAETAVKAFRIGRESFHRYLYSHDLVALRVYKMFTATLVERLRETNDRVSR